MSDTVLKVAGISKRFGGLQALTDVGMTIERGMVYGLIVMAVAAMIGLPLAANVFGGGDMVSDMPSMVGWATFTVEHLMFGAILGLLAWRATPSGTTADAPPVSRSATLA